MQIQVHSLTFYLSSFCHCIYQLWPPPRFNDFIHEAVVCPPIAPLWRFASVSIFWKWKAQAAMSFTRSGLLTSILPPVSVVSHLAFSVKHCCLCLLVNYMCMRFFIPMQPTFTRTFSVYLVHLRDYCDGGVMDVMEFDVVSTIHLLSAVRKVVLSRKLLPITIVCVQECFIFCHGWSEGFSIRRCLLRITG